METIFVKIHLGAFGWYVGMEIGNENEDMGMGISSGVQRMIYPSSGIEVPFHPHPKNY